MTLRFLVFAECAEQCGDPNRQDIFLGLAYGLMPMCVALAEDRGDALLFRRSLAPAEKDKAHRLAQAAEDLQQHHDNRGTPAQFHVPFPKIVCSNDPGGGTRKKNNTAGVPRASILWYNGQPKGLETPLHINASTLTVAWSINEHDVEAHCRVVPALLWWTRWEREAPWYPPGQ